ncbi:MAG: hypothetical protein BHW60_09310 [Sutterella sp. 54_7]|nr:MAG: hypothetical protein BHW60_09310 [Sutterella sp. 54_7]
MIVPGWNAAMIAKDLTGYAPHPSMLLPGRTDAAKLPAIEPSAGKACRQIQTSPPLPTVFCYDKLPPGSPSSNALRSL